jgi:hypothetical protein
MIKEQTMARRSRSFGDEINSWKLCMEGHKGNTPDFPFLKADVAGFEKVIDQAEKENAKQEKLKADLLAQTKVLTDLQVAGRKTYASLVRYAKAKYGPNTAKIKEFLSSTEGVSKSRKAVKAS